MKAKDEDATAQKMMHEIDQLLSNADDPPSSPISPREWNEREIESILNFSELESVGSDAPQIKTHGVIIFRIWCQRAALSTEPLRINEETKLSNCVGTVSISGILKRSYELMIDHFQHCGSISLEDFDNSIIDCTMIDHIPNVNQIETCPNNLRGTTVFSVGVLFSADFTFKEFLRGLNDYRICEELKQYGVTLAAPLNGNLYFRGGDATDLISEPLKTMETGYTVEPNLAELRDSNWNFISVQDSEIRARLANLAIFFRMNAEFRTVSSLYFPLRSREST